jgi:hypothetical protein
MNLENIEAWALIITSAITAISALGAATSYWKSNKMKRKEFVATQYRRFKSRRSVKVVMELLDNNGIDIMVHNQNLKTLSYVQRFETLRLHITDDEQFQPWEAQVRRHFGDFFEELIAFSQYMRVHLATREDLIPYLGYWFELMCGNRWIKQVELRVLWEHIDHYGFEDVRWLANRLGFNPPIQDVSISND